MKRLFGLAVIIFITREISYGQGETGCNIPIHVSADSLINYLKGEAYKLPFKWYMVDSNIRKGVYDGSWDKRLDTAFNKCEDFLIQKLGQDIYCRYVGLKLDDVIKGRNRINSRSEWRSPDWNLKNSTDPAYQALIFHLALHDWEPPSQLLFKFLIKLEQDSSVVIIYPKDVPECNGLPDCGFIAQSKAIEIAQGQGFLNDTSDYTVTLQQEKTGPCWYITKSVNNGWDTAYASVNLKTGEFKLDGGGHKMD